MVMEYFDHDLKSVLRLMKEEKVCFTRPPQYDTTASLLFVVSWSES